MRAFIGIDFTKEVKEQIYEVQQRLRKYALKGRWKHSNNFHLTLKFLGEINAEQQRQIEAALPQICLARKPFRIAVTGMGIFDGRETVRVLWLGLSGELVELQALQQTIDRALAPLGFPPEKRQYRQHITLGQDLLLACDFKQLQEIIGAVQLETMMVDRFFLFKSEQIEHKRLYSKVSEFILGG